MKFKKEIDLLQFMNHVQYCAGQVYFNSPEGDHLNLKSALSQYLFASICGDWAFLEHGNVECEQECDYKYLSAFLQEDEDEAV